ncbi:MAG: hypothetical protein AAF571_08715 [Verrucomicrobiota bacterium]
MNEELIQEVDQEVRPFVLEKRGGTHVILSPEELRQRWEEDKCQASDRVIDKRSGRQFPAIALGILAGLEKTSHIVNVFH